MRSLRTSLLFIMITVLLLFAVPSTHAANRVPFADGSMRLSILVGNGYAFDDSYFIAGAGFGYFIAKDVELGLDAEFWTGGTRGITKISPELRYVIPTNSTVRPYIGALYRRTIIDNYSDLNSIGGRAGVYFMSARGSYFGAGAVYEKYLSCDNAVYHYCTDAYPEIIFAIAF